MRCSTICEKIYFMLKFNLVRGASNTQSYRNLTIPLTFGLFSSIFFFRVPFYSHLSFAINNMLLYRCSPHFVDICSLFNDCKRGKTVNRNRHLFFSLIKLKNEKKKNCSIFGCAFVSNWGG